MLRSTFQRLCSGVSCPQALGGSLALAHLQQPGTTASCALGVAASLFSSLTAACQARQQQQQQQGRQLPAEPAGEKAALRLQWNIVQHHGQQQLAAFSSSSRSSQATRRSSSSSSSRVALPQTAPQAPVAAAATPRPFFWNGLSSVIPSRKPAVKRPARHQWHYCSPDYDPMQPLPQQPLPPYAPPWAAAKDYRALFLAGRPKHHTRRYKRMWLKNMAIADQRWRQGWEARLAAKRRFDDKLVRLVERIIRQRSWEAYKADQAAARVAASRGQQELGATGIGDGDDSSITPAAS